MTFAFARVVAGRQRLTPAGAPSPASAHTLPSAMPNVAQMPGRVGEYRVHGLLGSGGMARVYLAQAPGASLHRWCALKVPHGDFAKAPELLRMFHQESSLAAELRHPHLCSVLDFGSSDGTPYLAMELLRGRSVAALIKAFDPRIDPKRHALNVARLLADACDGLQALHDHGREQQPPLRVVHRDISPDNLFLTLDGFVKIIDFGLAKVATRRERTAPGLLKGKLAYIAPELLEGSDPNNLADIWGLGVVAWEALTARRLFHETTDVATLTAVREQQILPPSTVVDGLPPEFDPIVARALARDPAERYESADAFARDLWGLMVALGDVPSHRALSEWMHTLYPADRSVLSQLSELAEGDGTATAVVMMRRASRPSAVGKPRRPRAKAMWRWIIGAVGTAATLAALQSYGSARSQRASRAPRASLETKPARAELQATAKTSSF